MAKSSPMTIADAQKRLDALPAAMSAKGLREPKADLTISANSELRGYLCWKDKNKSFGDAYEFMRGKSPSDVFAKMEAFIAKLPAREEARMKEFMTALSNVIELGRQNGIEVEFVNPLVETMQRLSKNILTDRRAA